MESHERAPVPSIDLVVQGPDERILLGRVTERWSDHGKYEWGLPGREVIFGDDLRSAASRTLYEEIGLKLTAVRFLSVNSNFGFGNHYLSIALLVEATGSLVNMRPEDWTSWDWFDPSHLPARLFPSAARTLEAYVSGVASLDLVEKGE